jgi:hypothetical protein
MGLAVRDRSIFLVCVRRDWALRCAAGAGDRGLLFGITPADPLAYAIAPLVLLPIAGNGVPAAGAPSACGARAEVLAAALGARTGSVDDSGPRRRSSSTRRGFGGAAGVAGVSRLSP